MVSGLKPTQPYLQTSWLPVPFGQLAHPAHENRAGRQTLGHKPEEHLHRPSGTGLPISPTTRNYSQQNTYIFVVDKFHENKLAVCSFGMRDILEWSTQLLNGNVVVRHRIIRRT